MTADDFAPAAMDVVARAQARAQARARERGHKSDPLVLHTISTQLLERLPLLTITPQKVLDLGCRDGYQFAALNTLYPQAKLFGLEIGVAAGQKYSPAERADQAGPETSRLRRWWHGLRVHTRSSQKLSATVQVGDAHALPFTDGQFDLVVSNLCLPFCADPRQVFAEVSRVLSPGGAFLFSSLGPDTLLEYRQRWEKVDTFPHVSGLIDMHDLGDAMLAAGLADAVLDRNNLQLDYPSVEALEDELQAFGLVNVAQGRRRGLMAKSAVSRVRNLSSRFLVGLELVHGHAWKGELNANRHSSNDEFHFPIDFPIDDLRGSWKR